MVTEIKELLQKELCPSILKIEDESDLHAGHSGASPGFTTHIHLYIVSEVFSALRTIARHRLIYQKLDPFLKKGLHAVRIDAFSPQETASRNLDLNK